VLVSFGVVKTAVDYREVKWIWSTKRSNRSYNSYPLISVLI